MSICFLLLLLVLFLHGMPIYIFVCDCHTFLAAMVQQLTMLRCEVIDVIFYNIYLCTFVTGRKFLSDKGFCCFYLSFWCPIH